MSIGKEGASPFAIRTALPHEIDRLCAIDDDAAELYGEHGMPIDLPRDHPFAQAERSRWLHSVERGRAFVARDSSGSDVGFAVLGLVDGEPYLDQLAVLRAAMRRGIGRMLLARAAAWARDSGGRRLWLTTYDHMRFNRPYYERHGFAVVGEEFCGPAIRRLLEEQRRWLPQPAMRIAMRRLV